MTGVHEDPRFEAALAACAERVRGGEDFAIVIADYPSEYRDDLAALVPLTARIKALASDPAPRFVATLEARLLDGVDAARAQHEASPGAWSRLAGAWQRSLLARTAIAASLALVLLLGTGVAAVEASRHALPGSRLHAVREARESVELRLARTSDARVNTLAVHVDDNSADLERALRARDATTTFEQLGRRILDASRTMVDEALNARETGDMRATVRALVALEKMRLHLDTIEATAPREQRPLIERLRLALRVQELRLTPDRPAAPLRTPDARPSAEPARPTPAPTRVLPSGTPTSPVLRPSATPTRSSSPARSQ